MIEISFADDTNGLIKQLLVPPTTQCQSQTVSMWRTTDGAVSWVQLNATGIADEMCKGGLASVDATHAFLSASSSNGAPVVYRTADGGRSWSRSMPLPDPPGFTTRGSGATLSLGRPRAFGSIVLVEAFGGGQGTRYIFRSTDGGVLWNYASTVPGSDGGVAFVTAPRWLFIGSPDASRLTLDGGAVWRQFATDYNQAAPSAPDVVFGDASVGYATVRGSIQRTTDGGAHWTAIKTPGT
jgi:photosystem II stability/assembly factor-like uncharacterized protein